MFRRDGKLLWSTELDAPIWSVGLSADGERLIAGTWASSVYLFHRQGSSFAQRAHRRLPGTGVYGTALSRDGDVALAGVYGTGVSVLDTNLETIFNHPTTAAAYRACFSPNATRAAVGLRDGTALVLDLRARTAVETLNVSRRAICGVAISNGGILALGGFDGRVNLIGGPAGSVLCSLYTQGEVWSVALSDDASRLLVASSDGSLRLLRVLPCDVAVDELGQLEESIASGRHALVEDLLSLYKQLGIVDYGVKRLRELGSVLGRTKMLDAVEELLSDDVAGNENHFRSYFLLGRLKVERGNWRGAASDFVRASREEELRLRALTEAGDAFSRCNMDAAARSCYRRAREQFLTDDARRALYALARAYEEIGNLREAKRHYEIILSFDPDFRDVSARLMALDHIDGDEAVPDSGLIAALLGPDVPRISAIDDSLQPVIAARSQELGVTAEERERFMALVDATLLHNGQVSARLSYDVSAYMKYDHSVSEDELKKTLEFVNVLDVLNQYGPFTRSLDIGAATGRYPTLLASRGIAAEGVDIEPEAVAYANRKRGPAANPIFHVGDGRALQFTDGSYDLVTCMMGTAAHFDGPSLVKLLSECFRVLRDDGLLVISTWDIECPHLSFLSLYSGDQNETMRRNSPTRAAIVQLAEQGGFTVREVRPMVLVPDSISFELDVQRLEPPDLRRLIDIELASRAILPGSHGQMYMLVAQKRVASVR
ncbi:MAG: methyltransferase domain protein [Myxococcales bacterium]|nr:methyltransferase domain protein [Myxococcales bacterium]